MKVLFFLFLLLGVVGRARGDVKAVFAHFMVSNTEQYTVADWENDITLARNAKIDGFVMNMARAEVTNGASLANAFTAANNLGATFKLLFSFDYAGNGLWLAADVISLIQQYSPHPAYYRRGTQPLVSTFEGPQASSDWPAIKAATNCFFMPSWSSLGAKPAWALGTADGLFSWAAWPTGPSDMSTFTDASYFDTLNGKPFMMGVSPWFYTNMPGFRKNWLWRGDSLWFDRWINVLYLQPEYVQIITWNDYGESHYIGPLNSKAYVAFEKGKSPFNYADGKYHNAWRIFLPFLIDLAKTNVASVTTENVVGWYRPHPKMACGTGGTTGNTASQLQPVYPPGELVKDEVFFAALLGSAATITVTIGGVASVATWTYVPSDGVGLYRGSVPFNGRTGAVTITIARSGAQILSASGDAISTSCNSNMQNWNPYVIGSTGRAIPAVSALSLTLSGCTSGFGEPKYDTLCSFACKYDYCPKGACTCTSIGTPLTKPVAKDLKGCPSAGMDATYLGLCSFACNYGACPSVCQIYPATHTCTAPDPVAPPVPVCVTGMADGPYATLCFLSCKYGICPPEICTCTEAGYSSPPALATTNAIGLPVGAEDFGMCAWSCKRGICPSALCTCIGSSCSTSTTESVKSFEGPTGSMIMKQANDERGKGCYLKSYCLDQTNNLLSACGNGEVKLGWDKDGCQQENFGRSICCASNTVLNANSCRWSSESANGKGDGPYANFESRGICNGQCLESERAIEGMASQWGEGNPQKCISGNREFCCKSPIIAKAVEGCYWSGCGQAFCQPGETPRSTKNIYCENTPTGISTLSRYCCPTQTALHDCVWRGTAPSCDDSDCEPNEITLLTDREGPFAEKASDRDSCFVKRKMSNCCQINIPKPNAITIHADQPLNCDWNVCDVDPFACFASMYAGGGFGLKRGLPAQPFSPIEERGGIRELFTVAKLGLKSLSYPSRTKLIQKWAKKPALITWYFMQQACTGTGVQKAVGAALTSVVPVSSQADHTIDEQFMAYLLDYAVKNSGKVGTLSEAFLKKIIDPEFHMTGALPAMPFSTSSIGITQPMQRIFEAVGSNTNTNPLLLVEDKLNLAKGNVFGMKSVMADTVFKSCLKASVKASDNPELTKLWMGPLHTTIGVFQHLQQDEVKEVFQTTLANIRSQIVVVEANTDGGAGFTAIFDEFVPIYMNKVTLNAQTYLRERIDEAVLRYLNTVVITEGSHAAQVLDTLAKMYAEAGDNIKIPNYPPRTPWY